MVDLGGLGAGIAGGAGVNIVIRAIDKFSGVFAKAQTQLKGFSGFVQRHKAGFMMAGAAMAGATAAFSGVAVKSFANFEEGLARVQTLMEEGQSAVETYGEFVRKTAAELHVAGGTAEVSAGLYQTLSAGITDTAEAQKFLTAATKASVGGSAELSDVILAGTKAMAAFGLSVEDSTKIFDMFAGTVKAGQTTMGELAVAFPDVAGLAGEMGLSAEETLGTFAGLTKVLGSSAETSTALAASIRAFLKPSDAMKKKVKELGYADAATMVKTEGLINSLRILKDSVKGDITAMGELFPNIRALRAVFPALGTAAEEVSTSIDIVTNSAGLSTKQFEDMSGTTSATLIDLKNTFEDLKISFGEAILPIFKELVDMLKPVVEWFKNLSPPVKQAIVAIGLLGGVMLMLVPAIIAIQAAGAPLILILLGITAAIFGIIMLIKYRGKIIEGLKYVFLGIGKAAAWLWDKLKSFFGWLKDKFLAVAEAVWNIIKKIIEYSPVGLVVKAVGWVGSAIQSKQMGGYIPETAPYLLHKGEYVVPASKVNKESRVIVNIENIYGVNADDVADALQDRLNDLIST